MGSDTESQLIQVCLDGDLLTLKNLITEQGLNPSDVKDVSGLTPLHLACKHGHLDIIQYLIKEQNCDPESTTPNGRTPLHLACKSGHLRIVKCLITEHKCNPHCTDNDGYTPLHAASESGDIDFVQRSKSSAIASKSEFSLQGTLVWFWQTIIYLIMMLTQLFQRSTTSVSEPNLLCQRKVASMDSEGLTHHLDVVKYLITEHKCSPQCTDDEGRMPLHYACASGKLDIVQYLLSDDVSNLGNGTQLGDTPLHIACKRNQLEVVQFLLSTGMSDPLCRNAEGLTPLTIATSQEIRKLLQYQRKEDHFLESTVKVFVLGDHLAGKSSLTKALQNNPGILSSLIGRFQKVQGVKHQTVGIDSFSFSSDIFGDVVLYDFAGQREFHMIHADILSARKAVGGVFVVVVNIAQSDDDICSSLQYWVSFIQECCADSEMVPHVIVVGSHADMADVDHAHTLLQKMCSEHCHQIYEPKFFVFVDCTKRFSSGLHHLHSCLKESCDSIRENAGEIDKHCYALHTYVRKNYANVCATLGDICSGLEGNYLLPSDPIELLPLFQVLHDRGQVVFLKNDRDLVYSWVITNITSLLETVVGSKLFSLHNIRRRCLQGSTGVVPRSRICKAFPELDTDMIIRFLEHFEFCHQVNGHWIDRTELVRSPEEGADDDYYFFPAQRTSGKPKNLSPESLYYCGWFMHCSAKHQFFTVQFLQSLLLRIAFRFAQPNHEGEDMPITSKDTIRTLRRRCEMWTNGITWHDACGVSSYIEVKDLKTVMLFVSFVKGSEVHSVRLRTRLIKTILLAKREFCPGVEVKECIMNSEVKSDELLQAVEECPRSLKYSLEYVSDSISSRSTEDHPDITLVNPDGSPGKQVSEILCFEPYTLLTSDLITGLFSEENADRIVSDAFLSKLANRLCLYNNTLVKILNLQPRLVDATLRRDTYALGRLDETSKLRLQCTHIFETWIEASESPATYRKLRRRLDKHSVFCGRNPLELVRSFKNDIIRSKEKLPVSTGLVGHRQLRDRTVCLLVRSSPWWEQFTLNIT